MSWESSLTIFHHIEATAAPPDIAPLSATNGHTSKPNVKTIRLGYRHRGKEQSIMSLEGRRPGQAGTGESFVLTQFAASCLTLFTVM